MPERRVITIERIDFMACRRPANRHGRWMWFTASDVPSLADGESGLFEIERLPKVGRFSKWRVIGPAAEWRSPWRT